MWNHLPVEALLRGRPLIDQALERLVRQKVIRGWAPILISVQYGWQRQWRITPLYGPSLAYDRPGVETFLSMAALACETT